MWGRKREPGLKYTDALEFVAFIPPFLNLSLHGITSAPPAVTGTASHRTWTFILKIQFACEVDKF